MRAEHSCGADLLLEKAAIWDALFQMYGGLPYRAFKGMSCDLHVQLQQSGAT